MLPKKGKDHSFVLCHGFPELWYSYRHQLTALAEAGHHAVAPDLRGYRRTDAPDSVGEYSLLHLAGDMVGLLEALGSIPCVVVGHDEGSLVASAFGVFRPDLVRGVALLSVPYIPRGDLDRLTAFTELVGPKNYRVFFQEPGGAKAALEADTRASVHSILVGASGYASELNTLGDVGDGIRFAGLEDAPVPDCLAEEGPRKLHGGVRTKWLPRRAQLVSELRHELGGDGTRHLCSRPLFCRRIWRSHLQLAG